MTDDELVSAFERCTIDVDAWTHRMHLRIGYVYLRRHAFEVAVDKMRTGLRAYVSAKGVEDGPMKGYNETITVAWMHILHATICEQGAQETSDQFLDAQPQLDSSKVLRLFYSRDIWTARDCKHTFVPPDLAPLPAPRH
jgi:hypothetical protein